jgi:hypothetical protein
LFSTFLLLFCRTPNINGDNARTIAKKRPDATPLLASVTHSPVFRNPSSNIHILFEIFLWKRRDKLELEVLESEVEEALQSPPEKSNGKVQAAW